MGAIDLAKRRRIMQRSQRLGHCVCDPRRPCPCDVFTGQGICPCAGERPQPIDLAAVRLTKLVHNAGCASKIAPADLEAILNRLPPVTDPSVLSGVAAGDDAGVYKLTDSVYLLQTVDVMTPCCDDPHAFGRICAAHCLSDIYAMGGVPRTALSILAFPSETLDGRIMYEMLRGAMEVLSGAGVALIGGHSIKDEEIKLGFAITGTADADKLTRHETARPGDVLVLTKPLGVGVLNFARQVGRHDGDLSAVLESMAELNKPAAQAAAEVGVSACTDVTGFGLFGHLVSMVRHSGVTAEVWADRLPAFPGALEALAAGVVPGAVERNMEYVGKDLSVLPGVEQAQVQLGFDAQTSGGLLLAVPADRLRDLEANLERRGILGRAIGGIVEQSSGRIIVTNKMTNKSSGDSSGESSSREPKAKPGSESSQTVSQTQPCCAQAPDQAGAQDCCRSASPDAQGPAGALQCSPSEARAEASARDTREATGTPQTPPPPDNSLSAGDAFSAIMKAVASPGRLDARTKELIQFALVVLQRCGPCVSVHLKKAAQMGITREELDEAAWCAVAMGGAPVRMFYLDALKNA